MCVCVQLVLGVDDERNCDSLDRQQQPTSHVNTTTTNTTTTTTAATIVTTSGVDNVSISADRNDCKIIEYNVTDCCPLYSPTTDHYPEVRHV